MYFDHGVIVGLGLIPPQLVCRNKIFPELGSKNRRYSTNDKLVVWVPVGFGIQIISLK